jgi:hypothetical protein
MMPRVQLGCDNAGLGLIIAFPSGVMFSNQTGGTECLHPEVEGIYIPLRNETEEGASEGGRNTELHSPEHEFVEYFVGAAYGGSGATWGLTEDDAAFVESVLAKWGLSECLHIDRARLGESHEAWVHVTVTGDEGREAFSGFGPYPRPGILTWTNSD